MKKFLKYVFATFIGTLFGIIVFFLILFGIIVGSTSMVSDYTQSDVTVKDSSFLILTFQEPIKEKTSFNPLGTIMRSKNPVSIGLTDICESIRKAANDDNIRGIILLPDVLQAQYTTVFEIRRALEIFKESGKPIYSYADIYSQKSYILSSLADFVGMQPQGMFEMRGISSQTLFFKDALKKIGIQPVLFRAGKYKSAAESLLLDSLSPANREQISAYISDIWSHYSHTVQDSRADIQYPLSYYADNLMVWNAENAYSQNFVDSVMYYDEFLSFVHKSAQIPENDDIPQINLSNYMLYQTQQNAGDLLTDNSPKIAVVIAEGSIDMGEGDEQSIGAQKYARMLRKIGKDSLVQAVVLRINSGGGSALASDIIWREVQRLADKKPLIVSMGDYAASGGYYIAAPAHTIVAEHSTLTGSIGVFGMYVRADEGMEKLGLNFDTVKTNNFSDFGSPFRDVTGRELAVITNGVDDVYNTFKARVVEGRNLSLEFVDTIAQGRIWSGKDAYELGLVDTLGSISDAIDIAVNSAHISGEYSLEMYPKSEGLMDFVSRSLFRSNVDVFSVLSGLFGNEAVSALEEITRTVPQKNGLYMQYPYVLHIE
ncbi:MAG: signal peptide peptidase SppA [Bacteroidota bacterium]